MARERSRCRRQGASAVGGRSGEGAVVLTHMHRYEHLRLDPEIGPGDWFLSQICTDMDLYAQICTDIDGKKFISHDI